MIAEIYDRNHWHYYQVDETRVEPGDLVIDCGAAEGLLGLSATTQASYVYLIEPTPTFVGALRCTFRELNNCTIIPTAIGDTRGVAALREDSIASRLDDTGLMNVAVETIDHLFYDQGIHIDYIKSDIECHELAMLQGAQRLIARCKPRMALAVYHDGQDPYKLVQAVPSIRRDYCYRFKGIHPSNGQPLIAHFW